MRVTIDNHMHVTINSHRRLCFNRRTGACLRHCILQHWVHFESVRAGAASTPRIMQRYRYTHSHLMGTNLGKRANITRLISPGGLSTFILQRGISKQVIAPSTQRNIRFNSVLDEGSLTLLICKRGKLTVRINDNVNGNCVIGG